MKLKLAITVLALLVGVACPLEASAATYTLLPAHVYAPYYETYLGSTTPSISSTAQSSGSKYFTLAFIQSAGKGSCTPTWNGDKTQPIPGPEYGADIATLQAAGGNIIPSFGGYSADQGGTEIADSCKDVNQIASAYESVITTYGATRLDMDVERSHSTTQPASTVATRRSRSRNSGRRFTGSRCRFSTRCRSSRRASIRTERRCCKTQ